MDYKAYFTEHEEGVVVFLIGNKYTRDELSKCIRVGNKRSMSGITDPIKTIPGRWETASGTISSCIDVYAN
jgi:hypothetical protein